MNTLLTAERRSVRLGLQPRSVGQLLIQTGRVVAGTAPRLIGLTLVMLLAPFGLLVYAGDSPDAWPYALTGMVLFYAGICYYYAAVALLVAYRLVGVKVGWLQVARRLRGTIALKVIGAGVVQFLLATLAALPAAGLAALFYPAAEGGARGPAVALIAFIAVAAFCGGFVLISLWFTTIVVMLEQIGVFRAVRRSWSLTAGHRRRIVAGYIGYIVAIFVFLFIVAALLAPLRLQEDVESTVMGLMFLATYPFAVVFPVLLYYDIRTRKEHLNVEALSQHF